MRYGINLCDGMVASLSVLIYYGDRIKPIKFFLASAAAGSTYFFLGLIYIKNPNGIIYLISFVLIFLGSVIPIQIATKRSTFQIMIPAGLYNILGALCPAIVFSIAKAQHIKLDELMSEPRVLIPVNLILYTMTILLIFLIRRVKYRLELLLKANRRSKYLMGIFSTSMTMLLVVNCYILFWDKDLSLILSIIFVAYFFINIIIARIFINSEAKDQEIKYQMQYNEALSAVNDQLRRVKHGFDNTLASINGYVVGKEWEKLEEYMEEIIGYKNSMDFNNVLMYQSIKDVGLSGLIMNKFNQMNKMELKGRLMVKGEINIAKLKRGVLYEVLGILLDNAIEAAAETEEKHVGLMIEEEGGATTFTIENSTNIEVDLSRIYEKGWSTKGQDRGRGLWIVNENLKKHKNMLLNTIVEGNRFRQELIFF